MRYLKQLAAGVLASSLSLAAAAQTLVVGDQSFNARAVMEAAGVLDDLPYTLEWKQFTAGSPVAEALNVGSLDIGLLGDAPPLFLGALGAPIKVIAVSRQNLDGVAILASKDSNIQSLEDLRGKRAAIWKAPGASSYCSAHWTRPPCRAMPWSCATSAPWTPRMPWMAAPWT